jgi:hypothetical protein
MKHALLTNIEEAGRASSSHWDRCGVHYVEPIEGAQ